MFIGGGARGAGLALAAGFTMLLVAPAWGEQKEASEPAPVTPPAKVVPAVAVEPPGPSGAVPVPAAAPDPLSPMQLMNGPSLRETGRIAVAPAPASTQIDSDRAFVSPKEKSITPVSTIDTAPAAPPSGYIDPRVLEREIGERFAQVGDCRVEVARAKQVTPPQIVADKLLLRWIIEPDGSTGPTEVVATAPVDLGVMDCAKRVMSQWKFTPPRGGPKAIERPFSFWRSTW